MSDAQKEILKMLSDKVITVDEAERLLKALSEGEKHKEESRARTGGHRHVGGIFETLGETLADIGPMVKQTVEDVMTGVIGEDLGDVDEEELEVVESVDGAFSIKKGMSLVIVSDWWPGGSKNTLMLQGVNGETCKINEGNTKRVRIRQDSSHVVIQWTDGPLNIEVPETVSLLKVKMKGGSIYVKQIGCEIQLKTMGGDLEMFDLATDFNAKTMGGHVHLTMADGWQGKGRAHTTGGNVTLVIPNEISTKIKAATMGGTIKIDDTIKPLETHQKFPGSSKMKIQIGEESDSFISLKTMGGDIDLRRAQHAE